jgi:hypothetical protein
MAQVQLKNDPARAERLARANINPVTGLASDYLNHFNEAIMLLEMLSDCPECIDDFRLWRPKSYCEHFASSHFRDRTIAIEAYGDADPLARKRLEALATTISTVLEATRAAMAGPLPAETAASLASWSSAWLKPLIARAGAVINGEVAGALAAPAPQVAVDLLMKR